MQPNAPNFNMTDSVHVGHNAVGPSTGDIVISSGSQIERCSMCKTPIDAQSNPGLYCFKQGCDTLFCKNCESFFRAERGPGEKPYCSEHIAEFVGAPIPKTPPGLGQSTNPPQQPNQRQVSSTPTQIVVGHTNPQSYQPMQKINPQHHQGHRQGSPGVQGNNHHFYSQKGQNPYLYLQMVEPLVAFKRTLRSWNGVGRAQRSEFWWGVLLYYFLLAGVVGVFSVIMVATIDPYDDAAYALFGLLLMAVIFGMSIPMISQQIRRLHDIGMSGWWIFIVLLPYIGPLWLLVLSVLPSQPHRNRFG